MTSVRRRALTRLAAAVLAPGLLAGGAIAAAGPAAADDGSGAAQHGGATATLDGLKTSDQAVIHKNGKDQKTGAGLFEMSVDGGGTIQTYCIDIHNPTQSKARYQEVSWKKSSLHDNADAGKILWILQNSYPQVNSLAQLSEAAGTTEQLTERTAAAGTQVAIWRFSDGADVNAVNPAAEKLADYLQQAAKNLAEPKASLTLDPPAVSGKAGERLGPVTVHTNAQNVTVAPGADAATMGVKVTDKDGKPVTTAANGTEVYFDVPKGTEPGTTSLTATATTKVPVGRAFTGIGAHAKSQTQILAGSSSSTVSANATANWADAGAIPAVTAEKNCSKGGVDLLVSNKGDAPFDFAIADKKHQVAPGATETVTVPVQEDQSYNITVTGPEGFKKTFTGVLDCETASTGGDEGTTPQTGGDSPEDSDKGSTDGGEDLAETGSSSNTPMIVGIALALVVIGGAAMVVVRKRKPGSAGSAE